MKVIVGSDHAGFEAKNHAISWLKRKGYEVEDAGAYSDESTDYPDHAHALSKRVNSGDISLGVLICGSANGVAMTANKYPNVRAAICWLPEIAALARQHNNANVCCLPARFITSEEQVNIMEAFFGSEFEGGRHARRVDKIACIWNWSWVFYWLDGDYSIHGLSHKTLLRCTMRKWLRPSNCVIIWRS